MNQQAIQKIKEIIDGAKRIVIVQADNPDADSLGSALALEHILGSQNKDVWLYCAVDMPSYLHYMAGWDRVHKDLPSSFDCSIVVDASTLTLLEKLEQSSQFGWFKSKPIIVLDHHTVVERPIEFSTITICDPSVASTGELIYTLAQEISWPVGSLAGMHIMSSVLGDTQGLTNSLAKPSTYRLMAELIELGVDRPALEEARRMASKMPESIYKYKGRLIERTELHIGGALATVTIPHEEIVEFSPLYNPAALVQFDMLQIEGVRLAIVFKTYQDGKITGALRSNIVAPIAGRLAEYMGGGGHPFASGFKQTDGKPFNETKSECIRYAEELLTNNIER